APGRSSAPRACRTDRRLRRRPSSGDRRPWRGARPGPTPGSGGAAPARTRRMENAADTGRAATGGPARPVGRVSRASFLGRGEPDLDLDHAAVAGLADDEGRAFALE